MDFLIEALKARGIDDATIKSTSNLEELARSIGISIPSEK